MLFCSQLCDRLVHRPADVALLCLSVCDQIKPDPVASKEYFRDANKNEL
jgi:hypothetical protein